MCVEASAQATVLKAAVTAQFALAKDRKIAERRNLTFLCQTAAI
jgi:hypothetical protein